MFNRKKEFYNLEILIPCTGNKLHLSKFEFDRTVQVIFLLTMNANLGDSRLELQARRRGGGRGL